VLSYLEMTFQNATIWKKDWNIYDFTFIINMGFFKYFVP
jgi:hypothetical protein